MLIFEHPFIYQAHDINALFKDVYKLSTFLNRLNKQSTLYPDRYDVDKYKGDGFELFTEALLKLSPVDNRIGIGNYSPIINDDTGVDGVGVGIDGKVATVQIKYRSDHSSFLTATKDSLSNFTSTSLMRYNVDPHSTTNMLVITTAEGLHHFTENEMYLNKVRCLGYNQLRELVDNNILFWDELRKMIKNTLNK